MAAANISSRDLTWLNEKYGAFIVTRWSPKSHRFIQIGKVHPTVQAARAAAERADRHPFMAFVDIEPQALKAKGFA
jgi:hypothetical protein